MRGWERVIEERVRGRGEGGLIELDKEREGLVPAGKNFGW